VAEIWEDDQYFSYMRNLPENSKRRLVEQHLERLRRVLDYEVPIVRMIDYDPEDAAEVFIRINYYGTKLKGEDRDSAKAAAKHSGFISNELSPFLRDLHTRGFARVYASHLFRACAFLAQSNGHRRTLLHELATHEVEQAWRRTKTAIRDAFGLIAGELGVADMSVLWSGSLLVPVIGLCGTMPARERSDREIAGWVAAAALCHRYSRSSQTALDQDLRACRAPDPIRALLNNLKPGRKVLEASQYDFDRSVADRSILLATYIACKHLGAQDLLTGQTIQSRSGIDRHHILPRSHFPAAERQRADVIANIAFIGRGSNKEISDSTPSVYLASIEPEVLQSQAIPLDRSLWHVNRADEFWSKRQELLAGAFNDYLKSAFSKRRLMR
jgi:hypothetical protein